MSMEDMVKRLPDNSIRVRTVHLEDVDPGLASAWDDLESRAIEPNAYLSPHFILPALRHLGTEQESLVVLVEKSDLGASRLIGVGVFSICAPTIRFPLRHLQAYRSRHSYLTGMLVDREHAESAIGSFLDFVSDSPFGLHGVEFSKWPIDRPINAAWRNAALARGIPCYDYRHSPRAVLFPAQAGNAYVERHLSSSRRKDLRRRMRRLEERGKVGWRVIAGQDISDACLERFLVLEHLGWKGERGTSLRSRTADEAFFREMTLNLARTGRVVFTELLVGDEVIASTVNLISGRAGFAFKLGRHPDFEWAAPGIVNEVELIRRAPELFHTIDHLDSGAVPGSFLDELWEGRRLLASVAFGTTRLGGGALSAVHQLRRFKQGLNSYLGRVQ